MTDPSAVGERDGVTHPAAADERDGTADPGAADEPSLAPEALAFLSRPGLSRLWAAARTRLERGGLNPTGTIRLQLVDPQEREALSLLLAKPLVGPSATVSLAELDARLRASAVGRSLAATLTALGPPLTDRRAARDAATAERNRLWSAAEAALAATSLADQPWAGRWLSDIQRSGTFTRRPPTTALTTLTQAIQALATLHPGSGPAPTPVTWGRGELATRTTGSAHGLDDGTLLARLVLRGIALAQGADFPTDAPARRALWRRASVTPDEVSSTVLTYGLRPTGASWQETALRERADRHLETHLTLRELRTLHRHLRLPSRTRVHVCENPRVVEAAADAGRTAPLICTSGSATTVVLTLLDTLAATDCAFAYHGDFDWPGITLANRVMERYGAEPWRMGAPDYEFLATRAELHGTPPLPLSGTPVEATWDTELAATMDALGVALHEEAALDLLLEDLD
ncbi:TIGR02679 family protein [Streptomyces sp. ID01-12c]|uniref:TIGR02679 family protein n=1 Tax=Streptomyces caniscabiei TaxID=2746961 RepID=UPI0017803797|nr:TIGR02679 family protein [Streptomyces caniscabiei]MBD9703207.1 TIGR02679 family protein [Streptomyces caniscabiei]MDX3732841.1 TIGR02679 family protein [Streptomyces caniscabiei]